MREITADWLHQQNACWYQLRLFKRVFDGRVECTRENALKAARAGLDLDWLAERLLESPALAAYKEATASARAAYLEATAPAWAAYEKAKAAAEAARREATVSAWAIYEAARVAAEAVYLEATAAAQATYEAARAVALADALRLPA